MSHSSTLTLSCAERPGIVRAVTAFLFDHGCDIVEHQQFDDATRGHLFLRAVRWHGERRVLRPMREA